MTHTDVGSYIIRASINVSQWVTSRSLTATGTFQVWKIIRSIRGYIAREFLDHSCYLLFFPLIYVSHYSLFFPLFRDKFKTQPFQLIFSKSWWKSQIELYFDFHTHKKCKNFIFISFLNFGLYRLESGIFLVSISLYVLNYSTCESNFITF